MSEVQQDISALLRGLADSYSILAAFVRSVPAEDLHRKRGEGTWSVAEHVAHLAEVQEMGLGRITRILDEDTPEFVPFFPDGTEEDISSAPLPDMQQALADFKTGRDAIVARLAAATPEDWKRTAIHPEFRQYGLYIFARHILMHDHWHMYRMEELWLTRDEYFSRLDG